MMKKKFFLFLLPLWGLGGFAHASVTVTPLSTDFTNKKVTFRVEYANAANNRAWIWIDLCPVSGVTLSTFQTAVISEISATGGSVNSASLNGRGFYVTANPSTITATLSNAVGKFNWCAHGSDFPPNAVENGSGYTLKGSPPFILTTSSGTVEVNAKTYSGNVITALTDATGCPGVLCSKNNEAMGLLGCCAGMTNCSGTCKTTGYTYQNNGACTGGCNTAYVQQYNQCGTLINDKYSTYTNTSCTTPNYTTNDGTCTGQCNLAYAQLRNICGVVINSQYTTYQNTACKSGCSASEGNCKISDIQIGSADNDSQCAAMCGAAGYAKYRRFNGSSNNPCYCCN
jgi:hypothetical protein